MSGDPFGGTDQVGPVGLVSGQRDNEGGGVGAGHASGHGGTAGQGRAREGRPSARVGRPHASASAGQLTSHSCIAWYDKRQSLRSSLREYLILDNRRPQVTLFQQAAGDIWTYLVLSAGATIALTTIGLALPIDALYEGITLDPDPTRERNEPNHDMQA